MTIKQHGGIFGRNPTFNDVTITDIEVTGTSNLTGNVGIGTAPSTEALTVAGKITSTTSGYTVNSTYPLFGYYNVGPVGYVQAPVAGNFEVWADSTGAIAKFKDNLDVEIVSGNLVIGTSGKGIDFSATSDASGSTSELFDDYEEGTWTPAYSTDGTNFSSITYDTQSGTYTKVGRLVTVRGFIRTDAITVGSASGNVLISGLPYTSTSASVGSISATYNWGGDYPLSCVVYGSSTSMYLYYRASVNGSDSTIVPSDMGTGANNNDIYFTITYMAS